MNFHVVHSPQHDGGLRHSSGTSGFSRTSQANLCSIVHLLPLEVGVLRSPPVSQVEKLRPREVNQLRPYSQWRRRKAGALAATLASGKECFLGNGTLMNWDLPLML